MAYGARLAAAMASLERGPARAEVRQRDELGTGIRTLHVGSRAGHMIIFRVANDVDWTIDVLRILHDAMDLMRHLPPDG